MQPAGWRAVGRSAGKSEVCISLRHTYTAFAGIRRDSLRVRSHSVIDWNRQTPLIPPHSTSSQVSCCAYFLSQAAVRVFLCFVFMLCALLCSTVRISDYCLIVCSFVSIIVRSLVISGAAKGERRGEASPLWMDVQKLCNMCVLSLSWNFFVSHDKYIGRPLNKEPR